MSKKVVIKAIKEKKENFFSTLHAMKALFDKPQEKKVFSTLHAIKALYYNPQEKLTLEEISKEVVKETTFLATIVATKLKDLLDILLRHKYIKEFDLDDKTETKYQITTDGISWYYSRTDPQEIKARRKRERKEANERYKESEKEFRRNRKLEEKARISRAKKIADMDPQEIRAYYYNKDFMSKEEYKKNKKNFNKKNWEPNAKYGYVVTGYRRINWAEREESRKEWRRGCIYCSILLVVITIILVVVLF